MFSIQAAHGERNEMESNPFGPKLKIKKFLQ